MELIVIWVLFGVVSAIVMQNKGLSGCNGFAMGVLLGPFGLIIALVMKADDKAVEGRSLEQGNMRKCPDCAELIKAEARKCRYCGSEVSPLV